MAFPVVMFAEHVQTRRNERKERRRRRRRRLRQQRQRRTTMTTTRIKAPMRTRGTTKMLKQKTQRKQKK